MSGILEGIRILDFSRYIAGPFAATMLGDIGAEVIRIERRKESGDRFIAPIGPSGEGAMFLGINRNKTGDMPLPAAPVRLSRTPGGIRHRAPLIGQHTDDITRELGYSQADIAAFRAKNVI